MCDSEVFRVGRKVAVKDGAGGGHPSVVLSWHIHRCKTKSVVAAGAGWWKGKKQESNGVRDGGKAQSCVVREV